MKRVIVATSSSAAKKAALTRQIKIQLVEEIGDYLSVHNLPYGKITCEKRRDKSGRVGIASSFVVFVSANDGHYIGALEVPMAIPYKLYVTSGTDAFTKEWGFTDDMFDDILDIFVNTIEPLEELEKRWSKRSKELQEDVDQRLKDVGL